MSALTVVVLSHNRRQVLLETVERLRTLPERPPVVVVDNGSDDGSPEALAERWPAVRVLALGANRGAAGRNAGVRLAETELVAFCDDDSWFAAGALSRAQELFDGRPGLGLVAARIMVGPEERLDPTCAAMAATPLPGCRVLGFVACGAVIRRASFLAVGGFHPSYAVGGEERRLAFDMAAAGHDLIYAHDVVAHHHPPQRGPKPGRRRVATRNDLWSAWARRRLPGAVAQTARTVWSARGDAEAIGGCVDALRGARLVMRERRPLPEVVERQVRLVERAAP
jgi:N-acetylglucosaminyl-diphospho-decaprenol L-rhamnosyltransferase